MHFIEIATFKTTQKHVKQRRCKLSKKPATTVETSNGKFHLLLKGNMPTNFVIDLYIIWLYSLKNSTVSTVCFSAKTL